MSSHEIVGIDVAARKLVVIGERLGGGIREHRGRPQPVGESVVPEPAAGAGRAGSDRDLLPRSGLRAGGGGDRGDGGHPDPYARWCGSCAL
jgi:hypothetical protein